MIDSECKYPSAILNRLLFANRYHATGISPDYFERAILFDKPTGSSDIQDSAVKFAKMAFSRQYAKIADTEQFRRNILPISALAMEGIKNDIDFPYSRLPWRPETVTEERIREAYAQTLCDIVLRFLKDEQYDERVFREICYSVVRQLFKSEPTVGTCFNKFSPSWREWDNKSWLVVPENQLNARVHNDNSDGIIRQSEGVSKPHIWFSFQFIIDRIAECARRSFDIVMQQVRHCLDIEMNRSTQMADRQRDSDDLGLFTEDLCHRHIAFAIVAESDRLAYETWVAPSRMVRAANRFAETYSDSLYRFYDSQRYLSLLDDLKEKDSLRDVFRTSGNGELSMIQYREPDEVIVRHPDRSLPALSPRVPSDLEQLPCFSAAIDRLQSIDDELTRTDKAVVQDMVRLLRAVRTDSPDGFGTAEIRTYLCRMIENPAASEAVDTYLQTAWADIPAGCTNDKSALIDHCVGWESCPYRMHGSVPLREAVLHRIYQGRQDDI
jgi:hypothetical protein